VADRTVSVRLIADTTAYTAGMAKAGAATTALGTQATVATGKADKGFTTAATGLGKFATAAALGGTAFAALGVAGAFVVSRFASFEAEMSQVQAATGATGKEFQALGNAAIDLGADTKFSATEAAQGITALAKAGVSTTDILEGGLKGALDLAAAGSMEVGAAAEIAATAMTQFNLEGSDVPHVADLIAAAAGKAQGSVADLGMALKQGGLVASQMGLSIEETTAGLAAFASAGLIGSDAGTSLKTALLRLADPSKEAAATLHALGINTYDAQGQFVGLESLAGQLKSQLSGLSQAQRDAALATIFGSDAVRAAGVLLREGAGGMARWRAEVDSAGFAARQAAINTDNLRGDFEKFRGAVDSAAISSGKAAGGGLRALVQAMTEGAQAVDDFMARVEPFINALGRIADAAEGAGVSVETFAVSAARAIAGPLVLGWEAAGVVADQFAEKAEESERRSEAFAISGSEHALMIMEAQAELGAELDRTSTSALGTAEALAALNEAQLTAANSADGARGAARNLEAAYDAAAEAAATNGATLDINTQAGRDNEAALDGVASSARDVAGKMSEAGASTEAIQGTVQTARDNFLRLAGQMGLSADQANNLADQLGLVPGNYTANVNVLGTEQAASKVNGLQAVINGLTGKTVYIDTVGRQFTSPSGGRSLQGGETMARGGQVGAAHAVGGPIGMMASGQLIVPNYARGDDQVISAKTGEFVMTTQAVAAYGVPFMEAINATGMAGGGILGHGSAAFNASGRPERILNPAQTESFDKLVTVLAGGARGGGVGNSYNINVTVPAAAHPAQVGAEVVRVIKEYEARSGAGWRN